MRVLMVGQTEASHSAVPKNLMRTAELKGAG